MSFPPLVNGQWLAERLNAPNLLVLDATLYLPNEHQSAWQHYLNAHVPGARFFDIELFSDPETHLPHTLPSQGRFAHLAGELGIGEDTEVVVYDQKGLFSAARAWWLLHYFGHEKVAVLDGGLPKWLAQQRPTEQGQPAPATHKTFFARPHAKRFKGLGDVLEHVQKQDALILDARGPQRFDGSTPEFRQGVTPGHIPGSHNLPYSALLRDDFTLKSAEELRALFQQVGANGQKPIITSCGSGVTAAVLLLGLAVAGLPEGALYDGSWTEWGSRSDTPKATGP